MWMHGFTDQVNLDNIYINNDTKMNDKKIVKVWRFKEEFS